MSVNEVTIVEWVQILGKVGGTGVVIVFFVKLINKSTLDILFNRALEKTVKEKLDLVEEMELSDAKVTT